VSKAFFLNDKYAFAMIPKCGQHTLLAYGCIVAETNHIHNIKNRIAFIRHPVERLKSAFHFFKQANCYLNEDHMLSYEQFVDWVFHSTDEHVAPQSTFLSGNFDTFIKIDYMSSVMRSLTGLNVEPQNTSDHNAQCNIKYRARDIEKYYNYDYKLYESALDGLC